ncbi:MAG: MmgE/PrpD family protein [Acetobacteraceae bacterium]|jgi:aconitate decarboxylase
MGLTATLCERIAAARFEDLPAAAVAAARRLVLDGLAVGVAGVAEEAAVPIMARCLRELGGTPSATAIGCGLRIDPVRAAALNGAAMHVLDFEPMWSPATHALSTALPVALALAEARGASGRDVLTALVKGIELQGWLREASGQYTPDVLQFHPPGLVGPMGAVAAASHLLGLDPARMACAFGIAGSRAGSLFGNVGTMTKSTHCGQAAAMGLEAALLAEAGFTGDAATFESPLGYAATFHRGTFKPDELSHYGRAPWRVVRPGYAIKMFPSQFGTHFAITAGLDLRARVASADAVSAAHLVGPSMAYIDRPRPDTGLAGKFSLQYTFAAALLDGKVGIRSFTEERLHAPDMQALLGKITLRQDPAIPARFESMHVLASIELTDGRILETRCNGPRGVWGQAPISDAEHAVKARDCLAAALSPDAVERCIALATRIDELAPSQLGDLMALVGVAAPDSNPDVTRHGMA